MPPTTENGLSFSTESVQLRHAGLAVEMLFRKIGDSKNSNDLPKFRRIITRVLLHHQSITFYLDIHCMLRTGIVSQVDCILVLGHASRLVRYQSLPESEPSMKCKGSHQLGP